MLTKGELEIRPMEKKDLDALTTLENTVFSHPWTLSDFMGEYHAPQTFCRILAKNSISVGYLCCRQVADGIEILKIAVHPDCQNQGFASLLMKTLFSWAETVRAPALFLEVASTNVQALAFYRKQGFRSTGIRKRYYPGGIDAVNMTKNLMEAPAAKEVFQRAPDAHPHRCPPTLAKEKT